ncbi:hypothetical protein A1O7_07478 [Cladophialophora yegresii CBS 114405]|uniref:Uncharacterized protein n=1 Tax=Cladophialophora yegresii CBS 114405 TaxID=1182544 RepID=W9WF36_9EURO|nr:uncharacterized protein A1O7_07478 [Cladophialophora yegresii CBS 114405]EXJ57134.1 hypothetical protein A1O7_07478 [Cladophialophora yegresii CBS 114405]
MLRAFPAASNRAYLAMEEELTQLTNASTAAFFLRNADCPQGEVFHIVRPDHISAAPPAAVKRPPFPEKRQAALRMLEPCIFYAIDADRVCPLHQDPSQANPINNRPEDFLATEQQKEFYEHVLGRSMVCHWHDLPAPPERHPEDVSASYRNGFHRETTPKDMNDVKMLDSIKEEEVQSEESTVDTTGDSGPDWRDRPFSMGFAMSEHPLAMVSR